MHNIPFVTSFLAFLGFTCPTTNPQYYGEAAGYDFYRSPASCDRFLICIGGKPRLLICSPGLLFDSDTNTCQPAENVTSWYVPVENSTHF